MTSPVVAHRPAPNETAYLATATSTAPLLAAASSASRVVAPVQVGENLFVFDIARAGDYLPVIHIESGEEGWVSASVVRVGEQAPVSTERSLLQSGRSAQNEPPALDIYNNTPYTMTLAIGSARHRFAPQERRVITTRPGTWRMIASTPGVIPYQTNEVVGEGYDYEWEFYVAPRRR